MASQGERVLGVVGMCSSNLESMVQDEIPEQDIGVQEQFFPQMNPEPEMGAAAAAVCDTPPPHLRQSPSPLPSEATTDRGDSASSGSAEINKVGEMLMRMMEGMENKMVMNTNKMEEMRGEMQRVGQCLQAGMMAVARSEVQTTGHIMVAPLAGVNELRGSVDCVGPRWRTN